VGTIAIVHETLSQAFDESVAFDEVADRLGAMVTEVSSGGAPVTTARDGSFGQLPAEVATSLAMVLTEVMQNAVEHGFAGKPGHVLLRVVRLAGRMEITVEDDGRGLPEGFDSTSSGNLGLSIVRTLVESELGGLITIGPSLSGGTRVDIDLPLPKP
jgi:two-component sensor histidine kinase